MGRILLLLALWVAIPAMGSADPLAEADAAWQRRAEGAEGLTPRPGPIQRSIEGYRSVLQGDPDHWEARWKLLRSLHFQGEFVAGSEAERRDAFTRATEVAEEGLRRLARAAGSEDPELGSLSPAEVEERIEATSLPRRDVARLYFWAAIDWGAWSRTVGLLSAVREGVAGRLHRYTQIVLRLEPGYEEGGAYRLLGRLHAELPRVPLLTGWVDRSRALPLIEEAHALAPENPGNRYLLAVTLLERAPERRDEALRLLEQVASLTPRPSMRIEDLHIRREARDRLERERA